MIRPFTLITAVMFALSGAYLFAVKHRAQVLDDQISSTVQATRMDEQRIRVLQAQWALEAGPGRLAQLSAKFTTLQPMKPNQLVTLAALRDALPPAGSAVPEQNPELPALPVPAPDASVAQNNVQNNVVPAAPVAPTSAASARVATAVPPAVPPAHAPHENARIADAAAPARLQNVENLLHHLPSHHAAHFQHETPLYAQNRPVYAAPQMASALAPQPTSGLIGAQVMSVRAVATVPAAPPPPMDGGSMLGMAQNMGAGGSAN